MIYSEIEHFRGKFANCEALRATLDFLAEKGPGLPDGNHDVKDGIFVSIKKYSPAPAAERRYESHIKMIDVQIVYEGSEIIYYQPLTAAMTVTEDRLAASDVRFHIEPPAGPEIPVKLRPGMFCMLMPEDAHKTECFSGHKDARKVIAKIPVGLVSFK